MRHIIEYVGGAEDGAKRPCEPFVERVHCKETGESHEWDGSAPTLITGLGCESVLLRRFVKVKEEEA